MTHPLVNVARDLAPGFEKRAAEWDKSRSYCWQNVAELADAGIMGMSIPKEYGGQGASFLDVVKVVDNNVCSNKAKASA